MSSALSKRHFPSLFPHIKNYFFVFSILLIILCTNLQNINDAFHQRYYVYEQDAYMHLVIASDLLQHKIWYQHVNPRLNIPWGADTHSWTNATTALLAGGAILLNFFMPLDSALYWWGFWLPLIFQALAVGGMLWVVNALKSSTSQQFFVLGAFLFNPFLNTFFIPLRVDYDFLLITLGIVYWGYLLRFLQRNKTNFALYTALIASLGIWTSISFILPLLIGLAFIFWQVLKQKISPQAVITLLSSLCINIIIILFLEHRHFFTVAHDIISVVHLTFFLLLTLSFIIYTFLPMQKIIIKLIFFIIAMMVIFAIMNVLFPGFYKGPYNHVDPYLLKNFFPILSEFYSPFSIDRSLALAIICYFIIGAGYCYYLYLSHTLCPDKLLLLWAATILTLLTAYMYRWVEFSMPLTIFLVSFLIKESKSSYPGIKSLLIILLISLPTLILFLAKDYFLNSQQICQQQFYLMLRNGFLNQPQFNQDKSIFVHSNYGPLLVYATRYSIVATNDHHNPEGLKDSMNFFREKESDAKQMILQRKIDLILLCPIEHPTQFNPHKSSWLKPIPLPSTYSQWQLYRRRN
ncbi:hypothetical protein [Legionella cardiaca]|uniref:Glycosyltransferase RgtA/B/C/D-like domain-containing protein n=1 Tax=Legionella cardiaca TaxID=1071983 RepID=A0ABY8AVW5_9GAMM|nr:hypothetical protein [Legionella cardiaca]WED43861.1 hypothetical protein PXX05_03510 [Legionella cardiaca]